ncbi:hypothetical protein Btru_052355 [Bulinus truncatus]|nr:hypothetical protein Btru_052355 [Bulinus truncatus]
MEEDEPFRVSSDFRKCWATLSVFTFPHNEFFPQALKMQMTYFKILLAALLVCSLPSDNGAEDVSSLGCFKALDGANEFRTLVKDYKDDKMDVRTCVFECWKLRFTHAALQKGYLCYCGLTAKETIKVADEQCDSRCNGNCQQACGGDIAISIYKTGYVKEPIVAIEKRDLFRAMVGCYDRLSSSKALCPRDFAPMRTLRMSVPMCLYYCDSLYSTKFATLSGEDRCCCSNSVYGAKNTILSWCDVPCPGDDSIGCIGNRGGEVQWATFAIERVTNFKRWPKHLFLEAQWTEPQFPVNEKFEIRKKSDRDAMYGSLSGLLAKKRARHAGDEVDDEAGSEDSIDRDVKSMIGGDKRQPAEEGVRDTVSVVQGVVVELVFLVSQVNMSMTFLMFSDSMILMFRSMIFKAHIVKF